MQTEIPSKDYLVHNLKQKATYRQIPNTERPTTGQNHCFPARLITFSEAFGWAWLRTKWMRWSHITCPRPQTDHKTETGAVT